MEYRDYDAAVAEVEDQWVTFRFGGQEFKANLNVDGALMLRWMAAGMTNRMIPTLLREILGEDEYKRLLATNQPWPKYERLIEDILEGLGGRGNEQPAPSDAS